jgi:hypothetical protein
VANVVLIEKRNNTGILAESIPSPMGRLVIVVGLASISICAIRTWKPSTSPAISLAQVLPPNKNGPSRTATASLRQYLNLCFEQYGTLRQEGGHR